MDISEKILNDNVTASQRLIASNKEKIAVERRGSYVAYFFSDGSELVFHLPERKPKRK